MAVIIIIILEGCAMTRHREKVMVMDFGRDSLRAEISIPSERMSDVRNAGKELGRAYPISPVRDTVRIKDDTGRDVYLMDAVWDSDAGEMVAQETLDAVVVTARFTNVAERHSKVELKFRISVPGRMQSPSWQLRFYPDMFMLGDSIRLEPILVTGERYRDAQLRGYQRYERFLSTIITDPSLLVDTVQLEYFIRRNLPQLYSFRNDSSIVSEEKFYSCFGVSQQMAVEHYTDKIRSERNIRRINRKDKMFDKYVKSPIVREGIRLDTVIRQSDGDFIYDYTCVIQAREKLRKVDMVLSGEIFDQQRLVYEIPAAEPLTFYISSVSSLADERERYLTRVISRKASADVDADILFSRNSFDVDCSLGENSTQMNKIERYLSALVRNEEFELDSITVTSSCSPEGTYERNRILSSLRSSAISTYLETYVRELQDSLEAAYGFSVDLEGRIARYNRTEIPFSSRSYPENWQALDSLVRADTVLTAADKEQYMRFASIPSKTGDALDRRENRLKQTSFYPYLTSQLYPKTRNTRFEFHLHRKGMIQDTVMTTVPDTVYMNGLKAISERDYLKAVAILSPYGDYNTAVAYVCLDRNRSALEILDREAETSKVLYLKSILWFRLGDDRKAVSCYQKACLKEPSFVHRGNLDPEISELVSRYGLNESIELTAEGGESL